MAKVDVLVGKWDRARDTLFCRRVDELQRRMLGWKMRTRWERDRFKGLKIYLRI
jgi:hypothetical protein